MRQRSLQTSVVGALGCRQRFGSKANGIQHKRSTLPVIGMTGTNGLMDHLGDVKTSAAGFLSVTMLHNKEYYTRLLTIICLFLLPVKPHAQLGMMIMPL